jgi:hypothetical protein
MRSRIGALAGLLFLLGGWAGFGLAPSPPSPDASAQEWISWYTGSPGGIQASAFVGAVVVLALIVFYGATRQRVSATAADTAAVTVATVGMAVMAVGFLLSYGINSALALRISELGSDVVVFASVLSGIVAAAAQVGLAALMGGVSAQAQQTGALPRWLVVLGWIGAVVAVATSAGMAVDDGAIMTAVLLGWVLVTAWIIGVSITLWSDRSDARGASTTPEASALGT